MKKIKQNVTRFLRKYQMDHLDVDIDSNIGAFLKEMKKGLAGKKSSLDMIPTYIEIGAEVPTNKRVIAIDAGGTNFRVATVYFDDNKKAVIENPRLYKMPGVEREIGKDEFFKTMAGYLKDVAGAAQNIGFCFSYPTEMFPNKDGRVILLTKEVKAKQVQGQIVGENLLGAMTELGIESKKRVVILNDTVATLLAGKGVSDRKFSGYIGFILGTGTNCCYVEKNSNIKKTKDLDPSKNQIINTESGGFQMPRRSKMDVAFEQSTLSPGLHTFEKMISGAYIGPLCLTVVKRAADGGLFTSAAAKNLNSLNQVDTKDINNFMYYPTEGNNPLTVAMQTCDPNDFSTAYFLVERIIRRAAKLTAINLSAMAIKSGIGSDPCRPICIVAEGTTFYQLKTLKSGVEYYLKSKLEDKYGIYTDIVSVENATLVGAAIAGLTN
jgi:hexokinase